MLAAEKRPVCPSMPRESALYTVGLGEPCFWPFGMTPGQGTSIQPVGRGPCRGRNTAWSGNAPTLQGRKHGGSVSTRAREHNMRRTKEVGELHSLCSRNDSRSNLYCVHSRTWDPSRPKPLAAALDSDLCFKLTTHKTPDFTVAMT